MKNKNNNKKLTIIVIVAVALLVLFGVYELLSNLAFGFSMMLIAAIIAIVLEYYHYTKHLQLDEGDGPRRRFSIMLVGSFGLLAVFAMSNYFYPSTQVFSNNDHHAIALEGIKTTESSFLLAADSKEAFFDDHNMAGRIELADISLKDTTITLRFDGAGMPVYMLDGTYYKVLDGQKNIHSWEKDDVLELLTPDNKVAASIKVQYYQEMKWKRLKKYWYAKYTIEYVGNDGAIQRDTSTYNSIIRRRYSLASLFPGIDTLRGVDLSKIELQRPKANSINTLDDDANLVTKPFLVCYYNGSGLGAIKSGNDTTHVGAMVETTIKYVKEKDNKKETWDNKSFSIGMSSHVPDFRLKIDKKSNDTLGLAIIYRMPMYRYLGTEGYRKGEDGHYTFMIASTLIDEDGEVSNQIPENVLLFDVFDHHDNIYQMVPQFASFQRGNTLDALDLSVYDGLSANEQHVKAGGKIDQFKTKKAKNAYWLLSLDNFRDPNQVRPYGVQKPLSALALMAFVLGMTLLCCLSLSFKWNQYRTYIEPIAYIALLALLAIRLTLLWRASVFPPTMGITLGEFNKWRMTDGMTNIVNLIVVFSVLSVLFIFVIKRFSFNSRIKWLNLHYWLQPAYFPSFERENKKPSYLNMVFPQGRRACWVWGGMIGYIFILGIGMITRKPMFCVGLPVLWYFIIDFIINVQVGTRWTDSNNTSYAFFWQGLINMLLASGVMLVLDGGYGILFTVFSMLAMILRLIDLYGFNYFDKHDKNTKEGVHLEGVIALSVLVVLGITFMRKIAIYLFTGGWNAVLITATLVALFVALLIWTVGGLRSWYLKWNLIIIAAAFFVTMGGVKVIQGETSGSHTANRIMVLAKDPAKVLGRATSYVDMQKFLEASLNDWVLEEYEDRGSEVKSMLGERGSGYFKIQPHTKVGVSWMTQLTDLSVSRFIIAEQSTLVPILLIILFFMMEVAALLCPTDRRWSKYLLIQIPLLLTVQGLLVWMAVTRRFVFVGQDFPMISIISRVNLFMFFIGLTIWVLVATIENKYMYYQSGDKSVSRLMKPEDREEYIRYLQGSNRSLTLHFLKSFGKFCAVAMFVSLVVIFFGHQDRRFDANTYDVGKCVEALQTMMVGPKGDTSCYSVDKLFRAFQDTLLMDYNKNVDYNNKINKGKKKEAKLYDISILYNPYQMLDTFCKHYDYDPEVRGKSNRIADIFMSDKDYGTFVMTSFSNFYAHKARRNDSNGLIFIVKRRYVPEENNKVEVVRYSFNITTDYFRQKMPTRIDNSWRGNVVAMTSVRGVIPKKEVSNSKVADVYTVPASWTKDNRPAVIVKSKNKDSQLLVVGKVEPRALNYGDDYCLSEGEVLIGTGVPNLSKYGAGNYIARNVFINSHSQFLYPLQDKFFWARAFAEQVKGYMEDTMSVARRRDYEKLRSEDKTVTLSIDLTKNIYNAIDGVSKTRSVAVVVADGDGNVKAMVDHKKPVYRINPNDSRRIQFVEDSLKREGLSNRNESTYFFANRAIISLPNGPGSSQKPLVWTSVTTQFTGWKWNELFMAEINQRLMKPIKYGDRVYFDATSFAGGNIPKNTDNKFHFRSFASDESPKDVDVQFYMRKSSNYYNAIMVYIGSHSREELEAEPKKNPLFVSVKAPDEYSNEKYYLDTLFPIIKYGKGNKNYFSFAKPLNKEDVHSGGILLDGLYVNFGLDTVPRFEKTSYLHKSMQPHVRGKDKKMELKIFNYNAFPQRSYFNNPAREGVIKHVANEGVKMTALGKNSVWLVSPLKMAEMYGKMITLNKNYRLTIDPEMKQFSHSVSFDIDGDVEDYIEMREKLFIKGLKDVFYDSQGTAYAIYSQVKENINDEDKYYFYGKTGTINGRKMEYVNDTLKSKDVEDHLLAVVITNKELKELKEKEDYENFLFYIIYIADFENHGGQWKATDAAIVNTVLQSEEFKSYMKKGK